MRQATIAGVRCLAMMHEVTEQLKRKDGSIEDVTMWTGECRVPGPFGQQLLEAALSARPVSFRGPLRRESGRIDIVDGEVVVEPINPVDAVESSDRAGMFGGEGVDPDRFKLTGSGSPTVVDDR